MAEMSHEKLVELVVGRSPPPRVVFFDKTVLDVPASKREGRRVYQTVTMIKRTHPGVTDWVAERAQPSDFRKHPEEYDYYLKNKDGAKSPGLEIIPGLTPIHMQELYDFGLTNIALLANAEQVPKHLEYAQNRAALLQAALEGGIPDGEEEDREENRIQEAVETLPEADRREHRDDVGGRVVPSGEQRPVRTPERVHEGGRIDGGEGPEELKRIAATEPWRLVSPNFDLTWVP